ncbi:hypothetical protein BKA70DRAFT_1557200 [Coprinopsis sp. MPI-PUGE-AT-0042]|nr:hypothetical protein BKA70DRAFT_1557200 [Coprinopsis sp. MPI-PUGE-AT-0042]
MRKYVGYCDFLSLPERLWLVHSQSDTVHELNGVCFFQLVENCANYRSALLAMSNATAAFADSMQSCSGLKGPSYEAGTRLQAASGMHHLMGNLWQVLSDTLEKSFEQPLRQHLDAYKTVVHDRSQAYELTLKEKSRIIHETESRNLNRKQRNLQSFRETLGVLQGQVDELDELKAAHYQEIVDHEEEVWDEVQSKVCLAVRSTMDMFDRVTAKASDPIIEPMLQTAPDPFDSYGPPQPSDQIFSILTPLSLSSTFPSPSASPIIGTPHSEGRGHYFEQHPHPCYSPLSGHETTRSTTSSVTGDLTQWTSSPTNGSLVGVPPMRSSGSPSSQIQPALTLPSTTTPATSDERLISQSLSMYADGQTSPPERRSSLPAQRSSNKAIERAEKAIHRAPIRSSLLINTARAKADLPIGTAAEEDDEDRGQATPRFSTFFSRHMTPLSSAEGPSSSK